VSIEPEPASANGPPPRDGVARLAWTTFGVLFAMSLLDWIDRWTIAGVLGPLQSDLHISDTEAGSLNWFFLVSYCMISPFMGYFGDRARRTRLLALGIGVWSLATIGTGLARNLTELRIARSVLGVGEATYGVLAPSILMDVFGRSKRARVLSAFYLAMPLGFALGIKLGGSIAAMTGSWRPAFFYVGVPGLFAAVAALFLPEPVRGLSEGFDVERLRAHERVRPTAADYRDLLVNSSYTYTIFGLAAYTFAFGGMAYWLKQFLVRVREIPTHDADNMVALTGFFAAILGMGCGGALADRLARRNPNGLFLVSGTSMLLALPCILLGLLARSPASIVVWLFLAQLFLFANTGPSNAVIANVVAPNLRATAYAVATLFIHMLGDVWSPLLMGWVSDNFGRYWADTPPGHWLAWIGFEPVEIDGRWTNLGAGMLVVVPAVALGALVLLAGMRHLPREMALMQARLKADLARLGPEPTPTSQPSTHSTPHSALRPHSPEDSTP
jgi:MFS family permease